MTAGRQLNPADQADLEQWLRGPKARERRKYANVPTVVDGIRFDSKAEARRWDELQMLVKAGRVKDLRRQVRYVLIPKTARPSGGSERECAYLADFVYLDAQTGRSIVEDVKGAATPEYKLKRKLMLHVHGLEISEVKA